ncbi:MAG: hypothetical protein LBJ01_04115 [Tannerella sp.]|nr:hypothetical protein [Tannerella sp.]
MRTVLILFAGAWLAIYAQCVYGQPRQQALGDIHPAGAERAHVFELEDTGHSLAVGQELIR